MGRNYCESCGTEVKNGDKHCIKCGLEFYNRSDTEGGGLPWSLLLGGAVLYAVAKYILLPTYSTLAGVYSRAADSMSDLFGPLSLVIFLLLVASIFALSYVVQQNTDSDRTISDLGIGFAILGMVSIAIIQFVAPPDGLVESGIVIIFGVVMYVSVALTTHQVLDTARPTSFGYLVRVLVALSVLFSIWETVFGPPFSLQLAPETLSILNDSAMVIPTIAPLVLLFTAWLGQVSTQVK